MKIGVASGKGGTGKTMVATNLAATLAEDLHLSVHLLDCDVEEPNCHIFIKIEDFDTEKVKVLIPEVDESKCTACGKCRDVCRFNAIAILAEKFLLFEELCHSCGACAYICPEKAIKEVDREIGEIRRGSTGSIELTEGRLTVGEAMPTPMVRAVKRTLKDEEIAIIDAPPGASCPVIEAISESDIVLLVSEPTPFGLNDLEIAVEMVKKMGLEFAVVANRADIGDDRIKRYCLRNNIPIFAEIPEDRRIAETYSTGHLIIDTLPEYKKTFLEIFEKVKKTVTGRYGEGDRNRKSKEIYTK